MKGLGVIMLYRVDFKNNAGKKFEFLFASLKDAIVFNGQNLKEGRKSNITRLNMSGKEVKVK